MEFNMACTFTSNEDVSYTVVLELLPSGSSPHKSWDFDVFILCIQSQEPQTLVGIRMFAILMITFFGAKCLSTNEGPVEEPVEEEVLVCNPWSFQPIYWQN